MINDKIAIISDIHGNIDALEAALDDIDKLQVSKIYCLGDLIGIGPFTNEVLACITERNDASSIIGNHEESILALRKGEPYPERSRKVRPHHEWIAKNLDPYFIPWLENLPRRENIKWGELTLLLQHYHLRTESERLSIAENPYESVDYNPSLAKIEEFYSREEIEADLVCFGHHHPVHLYKTQNRIYLNPGALGCYHKPLARYAIVHNHNNVLSIALKEVPYNNENLLSAYEKWDVPKKDYILSTFHSQTPFY